ncbi:MAG: phosphoribosylglycinamide formyltransferase [Verrucomicrobia bacterium]|nr:phosphoribosylglycinamide formyltransferase [Verrucomicrobiota bacterium]
MRFVILGSGRGTNAHAILECWKNGGLGKAEPVAIFSDQPQAPILALGRRYGVAAEYLSPGPFKTKLGEAAERYYIERIRSYDADLVVLAGFMRVLKEPFIKAFPRQIINLHPSLLPSFKGLDGIEQAYKYGVKITGCTVHYVTPDLDGGPIIDQEAVRIESGETLAEVAAKVHAAEHTLLPRVIRNLAN